MFIHLNVFGKHMSVQKKNDEWLLFNDSDTGMRSRVYDVVIPSDIDEQALITYLGDIYHEYATDKHSDVTLTKTKA